MPGHYEASQLHVVASGPRDGAPVVLLHSIATAGSMWSLQLPIWQHEFRILNIDLPGHGASPAPVQALSFAETADLVAAVLDAHSLERAAIVGLSWGAMIAQAFALAHPGRVRALALAHTAAHLPDAAREAWADRITTTLAEGIGSQIPSTMERWFTADFRSHSPLTTRWVEAMFGATDPRGFVSAAMAIRDLDFLDRLSTIAAPTVIVAGVHDQAAPMAAAQAMLDALPNARLAALECAHLGNIEQPAAFTELVGKHLSETS